MATQYLKMKSGKVTLVGPGDHQGEERWHWKREGLKSNEILFVRIEKMAGTSKELDPHSPIISFFFQRGNLLVIVHPPTIIEDHVNGEVTDGGILNPYINEVQGDFPTFIIPKKMLVLKEYKISTETNIYGDFVILTGKEGSDTHTIILNIYGLGLFEGLDTITLDGVFTFAGKTIGRLNYPLLSPICRKDIIRTIKLEECIDSEIQGLHRQARYFLEKESGSDDPEVRGFYHIDYSVNMDRATTSEKEGVAKARKLFAKLFPKN